jgi:hypothetical protein
MGRERGKYGVLTLLRRGVYLFKGVDLCGEKRIRDENMAGKGVTYMHVCTYGANLEGFCGVE